VLKVIAVNPSKDQPQKAQIKAYLPKEVKPEDIIDKGDLETIYDTQQGSYYVYGEYELKPGEVMEKDIEITDIWVISATDLESLRAEAIKISDMLKNTEFADRVSFLKFNIESKLNQIIEAQKNAPPNPERHISEYRDNLRTLDSVKTDLALARSLLSQAKPMPTVVIWRVIIAIIIFLGLLGASFYFIWQKQLKVLTEDNTFFVPKEASASGEGEAAGSSAQAPQEKAGQEKTGQ
jgi:hypothetical protein